VEYQALLNSINRGVIAPVYLFYGSERLLMDQSLEKLKEKFLPSGLEAFNMDRVEGDKLSINKVVELACIMPVMAGKRLVIVDNPSYFLAQKGKEIVFDDKPLLNYLANPNQSCCLIFKVLGKADKRKKIYKAITEAGQTVEFAGLSGKNLELWIINFLKEKGKKIESEALLNLAIVGKEGLNILQNELEKLVLYSADTTLITSEMVQEIVTKTSEINVFNLIDSIANKEGKKALELLQTSLALGEAPLKLIYLLVRQFRMILIAKDLTNQGYSEKQIKEKLRTHSFVVSKVLCQGRKFTLQQLVAFLEKLLETEVILKSSSSDPSELMVDLVVEFCYK